MWLAAGKTPQADGYEVLGILGDVNIDWKVDMKDVVLAVGKFGTTPTSPNWNPNCDINGDQKVDMKDIVTTIANFGKTDP